MPGYVPVEELFRGRHFDREIIVLCIRWYLSFKLSYRDLVTMMGERGISLAHTTILRWVQHYTPEVEKRWQRYARPVGGSWRCDETYIKVKGKWVYLYRFKREAAHKAKDLKSEMSSQFEPDRVGCNSGNHTGQKGRHKMQPSDVDERTGGAQQRSHRQRNTALLGEHPEEQECTPVPLHKSENVE